MDYIKSTTIIKYRKVVYNSPAWGGKKKKNKKNKKKHVHTSVQTFKKNKNKRRRNKNRNINIDDVKKIIVPGLEKILSQQRETLRLLRGY